MKYAMYATIMTRWPPLNHEPALRAWLMTARSSMGTSFSKMRPKNASASTRPPNTATSAASR